ncbi:hypothetical protein DXT99_13135 [Pontibacter diazotrophicus]|uniref:Uncharacterized protein n=1 Tax=Pontibacter diazotrophicus TaxID=1400979 RepID=A0A3D8LCD3_9BACT|nr:hypothetical protein [Pontibacter diazotrophicus]RDV14612.1 hypothetical protein DXT99_13135 [Pontibacter diazotrophicus]
MVFILRNTWGIINKMLILVNAALLGVVTGKAALFSPKKEGYVKIPVIAKQEAAQQKKTGSAPAHFLFLNVPLTSRRRIYNATVCSSL